MLRAVLGIIALLGGVARSGADDIPATHLTQAESAFAEAMDAAGIQSAIESGLFSTRRSCCDESWAARSRQTPF